MNDSTFDTQALIKLINDIKSANERKQEYFYFCFSEPSDEVKQILKRYGLKYKIISNSFMSNLNLDENTALIVPKSEPYIKIGV